MRAAFAMRSGRRGLLAAACLVALANACAPDAGGTARDGASSTRASGGVDLTGAGATFPYPLYSRWFSQYAAKTGVRINYQAIGSGGGIKQLSDQTVDFGATDAPMTDDELAKARGGAIVHLPMAVGVVAVAYHLPGLQQPLRLTGPLLADIYLGRVTKWNDPQILALNPGARLPASDILVVHRAEGSGTTFVFSDYLSSVSMAWRNGPGTGKDIQWPTGIGERGNEGVSGHVKQIPGSIGYVELAFVTQNRLSAAALQNAAGEFVMPSPASATVAAEQAVATLPANTDYRVSIANAPGAQTYPITSFTWLLMYSHMPDSTKFRKLNDFLKWALSEGQQDAAPLYYAPLPPALATRLASKLDSIVGQAQ